jgi:hypothetical protein
MGDDAIINKFLHTVCANTHIKHCVHKCGYILYTDKEDDEGMFKRRFCGGCRFDMFSEFEAKHKQEEDEKRQKLNDDDQFVFTGFATIDGKQFQYKHLNSGTVFCSPHQTVELAGEKWSAENPNKAHFEFVTVKEGEIIKQRKGSRLVFGVADGVRVKERKGEEKKLRQATLYEFYQQK